MAEVGTGRKIVFVVDDGAARCVSRPLLALALLLDAEERRSPRCYASRHRSRMATDLSAASARCVDWALQRSMLRPTDRVLLLLPFTFDPMTSMGLLDATAVQATDGVERFMGARPRLRYDRRPLASRLCPVLRCVAHASLCSRN